MKIKNIGIVVVLLFLLHPTSLFSQVVDITLGASEIALNQAFQITIKATNTQLKEYTDFPEIEGFQKIGTSSSSSMNIVNGQMSSTYTITQNYQAIETGTYTLRPFSMTINGKKISSQGKTIKVVAAKQQQQAQRNRYRDPFDDFFGNGQQQQQQFVEVNDEAFFAVTTTKNEVYVGEGFLLTVAFYVSQRNRAQLSWHDLHKQLMAIKEKVTPKNCWEENFELNLSHPETVEINGVPHQRYIIYQSVFYPFNNTEIKIPAVSLKMVKYKEAQQRSFFGQNRQEDFKTYTSKPQTIKIKNLPPHPLRDKVAVGNYRLKENASKTALETNQSTTYTFSITGEGNINAIQAPDLLENDDLTVFTPNSLQNIQREKGRVTGDKQFVYNIIPNEPGNYALNDYLQWIYFNPNKKQYDTLSPNTILNVTGESTKNSTIESTELGDFYNQINLLPNDFVDINAIARQKLILNIVLCAMIIILVGLIIYKKKTNGQ